MKQIFFILGRNPELSRSEILEFLKTRERQFQEILFEKNFLILEVNQDEKFNIQEFGGTIHLGEILFFGSESQLSEYLEKNELIPSDKFSYSIFGDHDPQVLKEKFKFEKKKASMKLGKNRLKFQDGTSNTIPKADYHIFFHSSIPANYKLTLNASQNVYLGLVTRSYEDKNVRVRDMEKPIRRESLAISPRLSKILINLSGAKPCNSMLDPFCGIGGILQEALIKKIPVHGIDKDKQATIDAEKNLKWLKQKYNFQQKYTIENKDSRKTPDLQFAAIATESPLGKVFRKKPTTKEAKDAILNFEAYIIPILQRLKKSKKPKAKIAITFPVIKGIHVNAEKIASKTGLKIHIKPILESRPTQYVSRDILVFY